MRLISSVAGNFKGGRAMKGTAIVDKLRDSCTRHQARQGYFLVHTWTKKEKTIDGPRVEWRAEGGRLDLEDPDNHIRHNGQSTFFPPSHFIVPTLVSSLKPMVRSALPPHVHKQLARIEPGAHFRGVLPQMLSSSGRSYYAKTGSQKDVGAYVTEVESLKTIAQAAPGLVPTLLAFGFADEDGRETDSSKGSPYFITDYKYMTPLTERSGAILGRRLATEVHNYASPKGFGSDVQPYYSGVTRLRHGWYRTWEQYVNALVGDLLSTLEGRGGYSDLCRKGQAIRAKVIPALLRPLRIRPVLLHGGLWSGTTGTDSTTGEPVIFDASCVYGHNEADLATPHLFEGMPESFFEAYHNHMPKAEPVEQYELRLDLYLLFHHLNHTVLFGERYAGVAQRKMEKLLGALA